MGKHLRFSVKMFVKECQTNSIKFGVITKQNIRYVTRHKHKKKPCRKLDIFYDYIWAILFSIVTGILLHVSFC